VPPARRAAPENAADALAVLKLVEHNETSTEIEPARQPAPVDAIAQLTALIAIEQKADS